MTKPIHREWSRTTEAAQRSAAWGDLMANRQWSHWVTLTADDNDRSGRRHRRTATEAGLQADFGRFRRRLASMIQRAPRYVAVIEGVYAGNPHVHALVADCEALTPLLIRSAWKAGISHVEVYDARRGAAHYLTKTLGNDSDAVDFSADLPPRLHPEASHEHDHGDDSGGKMLELVHAEGAASSRRVPLPLSVTLVRSTATIDVVDFHAWSERMASLILRHAGVAA